SPSNACSVSLPTAKVGIGYSIIVQSLLAIKLYAGRAAPGPPTGRCLRAPAGRPVFVVDLLEPGALAVVSDTSIAYWWGVPVWAGCVSRVSQWEGCVLARVLRRTRERPLWL